jgi:CDP-diacylglycerol--glycerol-3-phosphate 3-phosphatidyltransferase
MADPHDRAGDGEGTDAPVGGDRPAGSDAAADASGPVGGPGAGATPLLTHLQELSWPDRLTLLRVGLIPVVVLAHLAGAAFVAALLFALAGVTDYVDGWLARKLDQSTPFGAFLDPVADKLMIVAVLVLLAGTAGSLWVTLPAVLIIGREVLVSALREWLAELGHRAVVAVSWLGKVKTTVQFVALTGLLWAPAQPFPGIEALSLALLLIAAGLTAWSGGQYLGAAWPYLRPGAR